MSSAIQWEQNLQMYLNANILSIWVHREIKHDITSNGKNETFDVCLQLSVQ